MQRRLQLLVVLEELVFFQDLDVSVHLLDDSIRLLLHLFNHLLVLLLDFHVNQLVLIEVLQLLLGAEIRVHFIQFEGNLLLRLRVYFVVQVELLGLFNKFERILQILLHEFDVLQVLFLLGRLLESEVLVDGFLSDELVDRLEYLLELLEGVLARFLQVGQCLVELVDLIVVLQLLFYFPRNVPDQAQHVVLAILLLQMFLLKGFDGLSIVFVKTDELQILDWFWEVDLNVVFGTFLAAKLLGLLEHPHDLVSRHPKGVETMEADRVLQLN